MPLAQTGLAVGSVSRFLTGILTSALWNAAPYNPTITVERPQAHKSTGTTTQPRINLFLYEVELDGAMRNISLTPGAPPPLWMVLRYLLTAFDASGESDTADSHDLLGMGIQVLMGVGDALPAHAVYPALADNPEPLKLTFDQATPDLLSRLMQGPDDKYRCSAAFQVRPVLIAQPIPISGLQLVGINYRLGTKIGLAGVQNIVLPSMGPQIDAVQPPAVEIGDALTLIGSNLGAPGLSVQFGAASLIPNAQHPQALSVVVEKLDPTAVSAGNFPVSVHQALANSLSISSGVASVALLPTVSGMTILALTAISGSNPNVYGSISLSGALLGKSTDYVEFALLQNGAVALMLDTPDPSFTPPMDQSQQQFAISSADAVPPGVYFAVFRVNGQQAKQAFTLNMVAP